MGWDELHYTVHSLWFNYGVEWWSDQSFSRQPFSAGVSKTHRMKAGNTTWTIYQSIRVYTNTTFTLRLTPKGNLESLIGLKCPEYLQKTHTDATLPTPELWDTHSANHSSTGVLSCFTTVSPSGPELRCWIMIREGIQQNVSTELTFGPSGDLCVVLLYPIRYLKGFVRICAKFKKSLLGLRNPENGTEGWAKEIAGPRNHSDLLWGNRLLSSGAASQPHHLTFASSPPPTARSSRATLSPALTLHRGYHMKETHTWARI